MTPPLHRDFNAGVTFPSGTMDALMRMLSSYMSPGVVVRQSSANTVYVQSPAGGGGSGVGNANANPSALGLTIQGRWAFADSASQIAATISGSTGTRWIWATCPVLNTSQEDAGSFSYVFALTSTTTSAPPGGVLARELAQLPWDGTKISGPITQSINPPGAPTGYAPVGSMLDWGGTGEPTDPNWKMADGRTFTVGTYPELASVLGTRYAWVGDSGGVMRLPDTRGRVAAGTQSGTTGAVTLLGASAADASQRGGEATHVLTEAEGPVGWVGDNRLTNAGQVLLTLGSGFYTLDINTGGTGHNNLPPYYIAQKIIRVT